jgi:hypothetical protein
VTPECFVTAADVILNFEGSYVQYQSYVPLGWESDYDPSHFWHLIYDTPEAEMPYAVRASQSRGAGYVYVTPDTLVPNPWDSLPQGTYWTDELRYVQPTTGGCTEPAVVHPKLQISGISTPEVDDRLKLSGSYVLDGNVGINGSNGIRFVISDEDGAKVDITIPAGLYDDQTMVGWTSTGEKSMWRDDRDPPAYGITKVLVRGRRKGIVQSEMTTTVSFRVLGRDGSFPVSGDKLPLKAIFLTVPSSAYGSCATFTGPENTCEASEDGVRCK